MQNFNGLKVLAGTASRSLVDEMLEDGLNLSVEKAKYLVGQFGDNEVRVEFGDGEEGNVRDRDVFVVNSITAPQPWDVHDHLIELLALIDAAHRSSAGRITAVIPYLGYNRQDRKTQPRVPITAAVVMKAIVNAGANRVLVCDIHSEATMTNFDPVPQDQVYASRIAVPYLRSILQPPFQVGSPDTGGAKRAAKFVKFLNANGMVVFDKGDHPAAEQYSEQLLMVGNPKGNHLLLVDDIIGSGGSMIQAAERAMDEGATGVTVFGIHGVLCGDAVEKLDACKAISRVVITDTIRHSPERLKTTRLDEITVLPTHPLFAEAIMRIHQGSSISEMIL